MLTLLFAGGIVAYFARERILKRFYTLRSPEKVIKINMFYPGNMIRHFYRLIPVDETQALDGGIYSCPNSAIYKNHDVYAWKDKIGNYKITIDEKDYELMAENRFRKRWEPWPEIFYIYGCPLPLNPKKEGVNSLIEFDSSGMERFKKNTILTQIYSAISGANLLNIILILLILVLLVSGLSLAQNAGLIHLQGNVTAVIPK